MRTEEEIKVLVDAFGEAVDDMDDVLFDFRQKDGDLAGVEVLVDALRKAAITGETLLSTLKEMVGDE